MEEELEERRSLAQGSRLNSREGPQENIALPCGGFWGACICPVESRAHASSLMGAIDTQRADIDFLLGVRT